ncbi:DUF3618 domain-containing protein [Actinokineospora sp. NBRC 105648]|uniref:DUF3618 domain-containing protein n=1 Tax=Actinokineospora sp. NBRC 105648 TaxID=3032206 RepID=UPI0024A26F52|nr:DUF3618 domain-containing protein [Actinokineospora sp. NBRC 105648]GLZ38838.1 hypothetical protein Acsp05_24620 [Actinokineospora sp. NBRC 105648]
MTKRPTEQDTLRADIEQARGELADTVDALVAKTDVKRRVGEKTEQVKENLVERAHEAKGKVDVLAGQASDQAGQAVELVRRKPIPAAIIAAVLAALIALLIRQRSR